MAGMDAGTRVALLDVAEEMADAAGAAILPHFRSEDLGVENKAQSGFDPVTIADRAAEKAMRAAEKAMRAAEKAMRAVLARRRPADGILGEEFGAVEGDGDVTWALDPIDGTRGFVAGTPIWGVLIAAGTRDGPVLGIVDQPYIGERFVGAPGLARMRGPAGARELRTSQVGALRDAVLCTTYPEVGTPAEAAEFRSGADRARLTRYGMDCYAYALLAAGHVDLVTEAGLGAYDIQAPITVVEAAGGVVTDWAGGPAHRGGRAVVAATRGLHGEALEVLAGSGFSTP